MGTRRLGFFVLTAFLLAFCACENETVTPSGTFDDPKDPPWEIVPDFSLPDVNPNSASFGTNLSPLDFLGSISAWYFGHAT